MDFAIDSSRDADLLVLTFTGRSTRDNAYAMTRAYFDIVAKSGMKKVLVDIHLLQGRLSAADTYFLIRDLPVKTIPVDIRTAIVEAESNHEYASFLEATSENAGIVFRCFTDRAEAQSWLRAAPGHR